MQWEYFVHTISLVGGFFSPSGDVNPMEMTNVLNHYGYQGWELVSAFDTNAHQGGSRLAVLLFKRPVVPMAPVGPVR